jgi:hypothetical protein
MACDLQLLTTERHHVRPMLLFVVLTLAANPAATPLYGPRR